MARYGITYEEVKEVAEKLLQQHHNPKVEKVRAALGNTGSSTTILKHMNAWRRLYSNKKNKSILRKISMKKIDTAQISTQAFANELSAIKKELSEQKKMLHEIKLLLETRASVAKIIKVKTLETETE